MDNKQCVTQKRKQLRNASYIGKNKMHSMQAGIVAKNLQKKVMEFSSYRSMTGPIGIESKMGPL